MPRTRIGPAIYRLPLRADAATSGLTGLAATTSQQAGLSLSETEDERHDRPHHYAGSPSPVSAAAVPEAAAAASGTGCHDEAEGRPRRRELRRPWPARRS